MQDRGTATDARVQPLALAAGIVCFLAAVVGGGVTAFNVQIPILPSYAVQLLVLALGVFCLWLSGVVATPSKLRILFIFSAFVAVCLLGLNAAAVPLPPASPAPSPSLPASAGALPRPAPSYSYFAKATRPFEDKIATIAPGGFIEQTFTARERSIGAVAVIASREHRPEQPFSDDHIGRLRLQVFDRSASGFERELPLRLQNDAGPPRTGGVSVDAVNYIDAVFRLRPVPVVVGRRYAFRVTVDADATIGISVRPAADPENPSFIQAPGEAVARPYDYAVSGFVCDLSEGC